MSKFKNGFHEPRIEAAKLRSNRKKLRAEERIINYILARAHRTTNYLKLGPEFAFNEMTLYLKKWKNRNRETDKKSIRRLHELGDMIKVEKEKNLYEKGKIDE
jgi:hypothetical protein